MEDGKLPCPLNPIIASSVAELGRVTDRIMTKQGSAPYKIAEAFKRECEQFGISLPEDFVKVPEYEQMKLSLEVNWHWTTYLQPNQTRRNQRKGVREMIFQSIQLNNGKVLSGDMIGELVTDIVNKFSEMGLSYDEGKIILNRAETVLGEFSAVKKII